MNTKPLLLESNNLTPADSGDNIIPQLRREIRDLEDEVAQANTRADSAERECALMRNAMTVLRRQLEPLHLALRSIFGELDVIPMSEVVRVPAPSAGASAVWETWKRKLGGKQAEFIQALLDHGEMTREQLRISTHSGQSTVDMVLSKLRNLSLIEKHGSKWALKQL